MYYLKTLFFNFLIVFFADHVLPGIDVMDQTKLPHVGGDLLFAFGLAFLNSLIYPILRLAGTPVSAVRIAVLSLILNFAAYGLLKLTPLGIQVETVEGYILASLIVALGGFLTNFFEMKRFAQKSHDAKPPEMPPLE